MGLYDNTVQLMFHSCFGSVEMLHATFPPTNLVLSKPYWVIWESFCLSVYHSKYFGTDTKGLEKIQVVLLIDRWKSLSYRNCQNC